MFVCVRATTLDGCELIDAVSYMVSPCVRDNAWKKRGIALVPTKFGVAFGSKFLCQAGALLCVYSDGSVLLSHGGMEMGQGLHTKMVQVCAHVLGIPHEKVHIQETNTSVVPNASPTAASFSTDLYGMAVKVGYYLRAIIIWIIRYRGKNLLYLLCY